MISIYLPPDGYISHKNLQNQNLYFTNKKCYLPKNIAIFIIKALIVDEYYFTITKHKDGCEDRVFNTNDSHPYIHHHSAEYVIEECMKVINA